MILDNEAKAALLNATVESESAFLDCVRTNAGRSMEGSLKARHEAAESYLKGIYCGIYSLLCRLGLEELYLDWVSEPAEEIDDEEDVHDGTTAEM